MDSTSEVNKYPDIIESATEEGEGRDDDDDTGEEEGEDTPEFTLTDDSTTRSDSLEGDISSLNTSPILPAPSPIGKRSSVPNLSPSQQPSKRPPSILVNTLLFSPTMEYSRRQAHIASEQKRRQSINGGFDDLRSLVPACFGRNDSKATVLRKTCSYLVQVQAENARLRSALGMPPSSLGENRKITLAPQGSVPIPSALAPSVPHAAPSVPMPSYVPIQQRVPQGHFDPASNKHIAPHPRFAERSQSLDLGNRRPLIPQSTMQAPSYVPHRKPSVTLPIPPGMLQPIGSSGQRYSVEDLASAVLLRDSASNNQ